MSHIVFVNYEYPPLGGGGGRAMCEIACRLAAAGHRVSVFTSRYRSLSRREERAGVDLIRIPTLRLHQEKCSIFEMLLFIVSSLLWIPWIFRGKKVDCVVAFFTIPSGPAAWLLSKLKHAPLITSLRGGDVPGFMGKELGFYHRLVRPVIRFLWRQSRYVVANSEGLKVLAQKTMPSLDFKVIPNGVDLKRWGSGPPNQGKSLGKFIVLTVGRLNPQKSVDTLIRGLAELRSLDPVSDWELWVVGDGGERPKLEALTDELGLKDRVVFHGWMDQSSIRDLYVKAHVFALTSINEGMPNVVLEAMACGLPIVSTQVEGIQELVENEKNGFVIPVGDETALAERLNTLLKRPGLRNEMASESLKKVRDFDWGRIARNYEELCVRGS